MNHVQIIITSWYEYSTNNMVLILYASILIGERKSWRGLSFIINLTLKNDIFEYRIKGGWDLDIFEEEDILILIHIQEASVKSVNF